MSASQPTVEVGDWIRLPQLYPGLWRVSRVLRGFNENDWANGGAYGPSARTLIFGFRLVNDKGKRSFRQGYCELSYVVPASATDRETLDGLLSDARLVKAFEKYVVDDKPIDLILNLTVGGMTDEEIAELPAVCDSMFQDIGRNGLSMQEIRVLLKSRGIDRWMTKYPILNTLQFACRGHEVRDGNFVYRSFRLRNG